MSARKERETRLPERFHGMGDIGLGPVTPSLSSWGRSCQPCAFQAIWDSFWDSPTEAVQNSRLPRGRRHRSARTLDHLAVVAAAGARIRRQRDRRPGPPPCGTTAEQPSPDRRRKLRPRRRLSSASQSSQAPASSRSASSVIPSFAKTFVGFDGLRCGSGREHPASAPRRPPRIAIHANAAITVMTESCCGEPHSNEPASAAASDGPAPRARSDRDRGSARVAGSFSRTRRTRAGPCASMATAPRSPRLTGCSPSRTAPTPASSSVGSSRGVSSSAR